MGIEGEVLSPFAPEGWWIHCLTCWLVGPLFKENLCARKCTNCCLLTSGNPQPSRGDKLGNKQYRMIHVTVEVCAGCYSNRGEEGLLCPTGC